MQFVLVSFLAGCDHKPTNCSVDTPLSSAICTSCYRIVRIYFDTCKSYYSID